jgi:opacity protein-like surface antigen
MMFGKRVLSVVLFVVALAVCVAAQDEKNELSGGIGRTFISTQPIQGVNVFDPNIRYGKGWDVEGSYARRLLVTPVFSVAAELPVVFNFDEKIHASSAGLGPGEYKELFITPSARVNLFPTTAVSLWGSVGGGFGRISEGSKLLYGSSNPGKSTTSGVLQYGVGLDVKVTKRLILRGEGRDFWAGEPDFPLAPTGKTRQHNYFVGVGLVWRF